MKSPFIVQVHALVPYGASLPNRERNGLAKRISFGGAVRQRISSQCLKKAWREQQGPGSLQDLGAKLGQSLSIRSAKIFSDVLPGKIAANLLRLDIGPKSDLERTAWATYAATVLKSLFSSKAGDKNEKSQIIVMGGPEIDALVKVSAEMCRSGYDVEAHWRLLSKEDAAVAEGDDAEAPARKGKKSPEEREAEKAAKAAGDKAVKQAKKAFDDLLKSKEIKEILKSVEGHAGIDGALMGRMITADQFSRVDAAIGVGHAITVHAIESVSDFFAATDTVSQEPGAAMIGESELTTGLFYQYATLDLRAALQNLQIDVTPAAVEALVEWFVGSFVRIQPAAKFGSTAAVSAPVFMMVEWGDRQAINLVQAFREPVRGSHNCSQEALSAVRMVKRSADLERMTTVGSVKRAGVAVSDIAEQVGDKLGDDLLRSNIGDVVKLVSHDAMAWYGA